MFEFTVARKYLIPRVRQLSVSIISLISVFVIAIVVWLSIVFFSAQDGIVKSWTEKMIALTSPLRLTPSKEYYKSYYYQIDAFADKSNYSYKTLKEKLKAEPIDPYDAEFDPSLPKNFPKKESLDIVQATMQALSSISGIKSHIFETAQASLTIHMVRDEMTEQELKTTTFVMSPEDVSVRLNVKLTNNKNIILPKSFHDAGVQVGDIAFLQYKGFGASASQDLRTKLTCQGFYDPGILPVGGRVAIVSSQLISEILSASLGAETNLPTGIGVDFANLDEADSIKDKIIEALEKKGLARYWNVETYSEYEFTKEIFQQMRADKNLFSLISIIITFVACSNIISMLIILVHDKRREIATMRALGASKTSIGFIFGLCGFLLGTIGSIVGACLAVLTLKNLSLILAFIGKLQGFEVLSAQFYANSLPNEVSITSLLFVIAIAAVSSCLAGIIPAIKASRINTSEALRNE